MLANPPFNDSDWIRNEEDARWKYGTPPKGNANYAWVQHFIHHPSPTGFAGFVLTPGRYVGAEEVEDDGEPFDEKMQRLVAELNGQFAESRKLEKAIRQNLAGLGFSEDRP